MAIVILERPTGNGKKSQLLYHLLASHRSRKQNPPSQNSTPNTLALCKPFGLPRATLGSFATVTCSSLAICCLFQTVCMWEGVCASAHMCGDPKVSFLGC